MKIIKKLSILLALVLITGIFAGCSSDNDNNEIVIMEGNISEADIVGSMAGILIEEYTDLEVTFHDSMNTVPFSNAVEAGQIDLGLSYDGTLLATHLNYDPSEVPEGEDLFDWANQKGEEDRNLMLVGNLGFENTYALAVRNDFAEENNLETISDLREYSSNLVFGAEHDFFDEEGTVRLNPMNNHYDLEWKDTISMEMAYKYTAMDNQNIDVTVTFTTDGLNVKSNLFALEDDQDFFPQYYGSLYTRATLYEEFAETAPNLEEVLTMLDGKLDNETMTQMNYEADAEGRDPEELAREFLVQEGLIEE